MNFFSFRVMVGPTAEMLSNDIVYKPVKLYPSPLMSSGSATYLKNLKFSGKLPENIKKGYRL